MVCEDFDAISTKRDTNNRTDNPRIYFVFEYYNMHKSQKRCQRSMGDREKNFDYWKINKILESAIINQIFPHGVRIIENFQSVLSWDFIIQFKWNGLQRSKTDLFVFEGIQKLSKFF